MIMRITLMITTIIIMIIINNIIITKRSPSSHLSPYDHDRVIATVMINTINIIRIVIITKLINTTINGRIYFEYVLFVCLYVKERAMSP